MYTTRELNQKRTHHQADYRNTARIAEYGCFVPAYLQDKKYGLVKTVYLKNNMEQLKVVKKQRDLDPKTYRNDRGYVFYSPREPPLDRQIVDANASVFKYDVELQQKSRSSSAEQSTTLASDRKKDQDV